MSTGFARRESEVSADPPKSDKKLSAPFVDKKKQPKIWIRLFQLQGYEPVDIRYHIETAVIPIKGKTKRWKLRTYCLDKVCAKCQSNSKAYRRDKDIPYEIKMHKGAFFMALLVYPDVTNGTFSYGQKIEPHRFEYKFRYKKVPDPKKPGEEIWALVCDDWLNLMDAYEAAVAAGLDPTDPEKGCIFEVQYSQVETGGTNLKDVFTHKALTDKTIALPEGWQALVEKYYPLDSLYTNLSQNDMKIVVETTEAIYSVLNDASLPPEARKARAYELYANYSRVSNKDFERTLKWHETSSEQGFGGQGAPPPDEGGYNRQSESSLSGAPQSQTAAPAARTSAPAPAQATQAPKQQVTTTPPAQTQAAPASAPAHPPAAAPAAAAKTEEKAAPAPAAQPAAPAHEAAPATAPEAPKLSETASDTLATLRSNLRKAKDGGGGGKG